MVKIAEDPSNFIMAIPLAPDHTWSAGKAMPLWTVKASEGITSAQNPFIMGGQGNFWPLPLQRQGPCSTLMWRVTLPDDFTTSWLNYMVKHISGEWKGLFWTLSKRYDLSVTPTTSPMLTKIPTGWTRSLRSGS